MTKSILYSRRQFLKLGAAGLGAAAFGAAGLGLTSCSNPDSAAKDPELIPIKLVLDWTPNTNHTGLYVALEKGFYTQAGLDVQLLPAPEDGADPLVAAGKAQFGISAQDTMSTYLSGSQVLPVSALAAIIQHNTSGILSPKDLNITRPRDMVGHTYATWDLPVEQAILKSAVEGDGGDFSKVKMIPQTITDEVTALSTHQVDCIWVFEAWAKIKCELEHFATNYFGFAQVNPVFDYYTPLIITNNDYAEKYPDQVKQFLAATKQGYEFAIQNPEASAEILLQQVPELDRELVMASQKFLSGAYAADAESWGVITDTRWNTFNSWLNEQKIFAPLAENAGLNPLHL